MKKSDKLLAKLGQSLDPNRVPPAARTGRRPASGRARSAAAAGPLTPAATVDPVVLPEDPIASPPPSTALPPIEAAAEAAEPAREPAVNACDPAGTGLADHRPAADAIIRAHLPYALGAGLIPLPLADVAAISAVQLRLISQLSALYGVPFAANQAKAIVAALLGGAGSITVATSLLGSMAKIIPGAGFVLGAGAVPLTAGALTYAVGQVFRSHFESGGTLLDFDVAVARQAFLQKVEEGRATLRSL